MAGLDVRMRWDRIGCDRIGYEGGQGWRVDW